MSVEIADKVRQHFDADARRFDAIYVDQNKSFLANWIDRVWRGVVRRRLDLVLRLLEPMNGKTILDVGCGSGRFSVAYAERGAAVVGVDFAPKMIELARALAEERHVAHCCDFRTGIFPEAVPDGPFDVSTALGFFDYIADPVPILIRMRELSRKSLIMSFPKAREWRAPLRRLRFWLNGCPLFLYREQQVKELLLRAGLTRCDWVILDRDYVVMAHL